MSDTHIAYLTLDSLGEAFQLAGYRAEKITDAGTNTVYLRSATNGLAFDIRPGNQLADGRFVDAALVAVLQVQGEMPLDIVNRWNASRRFARLQLSTPFLLLTLDVSVAGGVTQNHLRAQIEIWDYLLQQLIVYLREELPKIAVANSNSPAATSDAVKPETDHRALPNASVALQ